MKKESIFLAAERMWKDSTQVSLPARPKVPVPKRPRSSGQAKQMQMPLPGEDH